MATSNPEMQGLIEYLNGVTKIPLAYVIRDVRDDPVIFDACVNLFPDFLTHNKAESPNVTFATVGQYQHKHQKDWINKPRAVSTHGFKSGAAKVSIADRLLQCCFINC